MFADLLYYVVDAVTSGRGWTGIQAANLCFSDMPVPVSHSSLPLHTPHYPHCRRFIIRFHPSGDGPVPSHSAPATSVCGGPSPQHMARSGGQAEDGGAFCRTKITNGLSWYNGTYRLQNFSNTGTSRAISCFILLPAALPRTPAHARKEGIQMTGGACYTWTPTTLPSTTLLRVDFFPPPSRNGILSCLRTRLPHGSVNSRTGFLPGLCDTGWCHAAMPHRAHLAEHSGPATGIYSAAYAPLVTNFTTALRRTTYCSTRGATTPLTPPFGGSAGSHSDYPHSPSPARRAGTANTRLRTRGYGGSHR